MFASWWHRRLGQPLSPSRRSNRPRAYRPRLELLEDRLAPATHTWTGASGIDRNWDTDANWMGNSKPVVGEAGPVILNFPSIVDISRNTVNNLPGGTLTVDQINFTDSDYSLAGASIVVSGATTPAFTNAGPTNVIDLSMTLNGTSTFQINSGDLTVSGSIAGSGGVTKTGPGLLSFSGFSGNANSYTGITQVLDGVLQVSKSISALGLIAIPGNLVIGDGTGAAGSAEVQVNFDDQIADSATVTANSDGRLTLNTQQETIASLDLTGATVQTVNGTLNLLGPVTATSVAGPNGENWENWCQRIGVSSFFLRELVSVHFFWASPEKMN